MDTPVLSSTLFLTILMMIGLFFFIRASVKDRTEVVKFMSAEPEESLKEKLQKYFESRSYKLKDTVKEPNVLSFAGLVRPSFFLAIFLSLLAAIGLLSLSLVLALLYPAGGKLFLLLVLLAPLAGWFYWQKAERIEEIKLKIEALPLNEAESLTQVTIVAHRDEIIQLEQDKSFNFISNR